MCTAITYKTKDLYLGRTLDYERSFSEEIVITPREFPLSFRPGEIFRNRYAMIGMAHVARGIPLYFDAVNEKGLAMAGLNFVGNARYTPGVAGKDNVPHFGVIPWILGQCATLEEAKNRLRRLNITPEPFGKEYPVAQLHWFLADRQGSVAVEATGEGLGVWEDPVGVLTNNPPFPQQLLQLQNYIQLSAEPPRNRFSDRVPLEPYSRGMGAMGLPGDLSSPSRFVRAAFTKLNSVSGDSEAESVSQVFHILETVSQTRGCCRLEDGSFEITRYSACCNAQRGIYYYTTYENRQITAVDMHRFDLEGAALGRVAPVTQPQIAQMPPL